MKKTLKILNIALCVVLAIIICINLYGLVARIVFKQDLPKIFGVASAVVISGSMAPTIDVNDMVLIRESDSYDVRDIVTYRSEGKLITHRVIEKTENGYITQGDYIENSPDEEIKGEQIEGRVVLTIPKAGYVISFIRSPAGLLSLLALGAALLYLPALLKKKEQVQD